MTENNIALNFTEFINSIENFVKEYSSEYSYTDQHITQYKNDKYNSIIYKNKDCIKQLSLDYPEINFGNCYYKVKDKNKIEEDLIVVIINKMDDENNPTTSYSFFDPISGKKLDTEICKNDTILIVEKIFSVLNENISNYNAMLTLMNQGINIFNSTDDFYFNLCYDFSFETEKDIALKDRIKIFFPNISLCDSGCIQTSVDLINYTANCECKFNDISDMGNNNENNEKVETILLKNILGDLFDILDSSNIQVVKCFSKGMRHTFKHYGLYITLILLFMNIILSVVYCLRDLHKLKIYIYNITEKFLGYLSSLKKANNSQPPLKNNKNKKEKNKNKKEINNNKNKNKINIKKEKFFKSKRNNIKNLNIMISINKNSILKTKNINFKSKLNHEDNSNVNSSFRLKDASSKFRLKNNLKQRNKILKTNNKYSIFFKDYFSESPDEMDFDDSIRLDKRKFCEFLCDNLKNKQIILNTFCSYDPFKPRTIKIIIFLLNFFLYFDINALFINDEYISEIYYLENKENIFSFIPRSINRFVYTTIVSILIEFLVGFFFVEEKKLKKLFLREKENRMNIKKEIISLIIFIRNRIIAFIACVFIIYFICLYYLICFNSIYPKIQMEWIKSSLFIFIIRQILSILQSILETTLRFISFKCESEKMYKISKLIN